MHHLLSLPGDWLAWRWVCVRSAGFPIDEPVALAASPELIAALDELCVLDDNIERQFSSMFEVCRDARAAVGFAHRDAWTKVLKALERRAVPAAAPPDAPPAVAAGLAELAELVTRRDARIATTKKVFSADGEAAARLLRHWAGEPRFREALLMQNPDALRNGANPLLSHPVGTSNYKTRRLEQLIANYLQRYCTKNDTIPFFGPLGWGELVDDGPFLFECGEPLMRRREMFLEHWMVDALADTYSTRPGLRIDLAPRLSPTVRLEDDTLVVPVEQRTPLSPATSAVLRLCDGTRSASEIAATVCAATELEFSDEAEVFELLEDLVKQSIVIWRLGIPTVGYRFERVLREKLEALPASDARTTALEELTAIEAAFQQVAGSRGDPDRMAPAVEELSRSFVAQTAREASRHGGAIYAARTLYYEDCVRNIDVKVASSLTRAISPALELLAQAARWCTYEIARGYLRAFEQAYRRLVDGGAPTAIPYLQFWDAVAEYFPQRLKQRSTIVEAVGMELLARWGEILAIDASASRCQRSSEVLRSRVLERFAAPHPGWPSARYHSPDVMIAAPDVATIEDGRALLVLGEFHPSINNLCLPFVLHQHPAASDLIAARERDIPQVCIAPVTSRHNTTRSDHNWTSTHHLDLELGDTPSWRPRDQVLAVSDLVLDRGPRGLEVRTRDGRHHFDPITFFEYQIIAAGMTQFSVLPPLPHSPRVMFDDLIVVRESWRFERAELAAASVEDRLARVQAVHAWRRRHQLPRFVFFRVSQEWKPCFLDFESPTYIDIFTQLVRKCEYVTISEMLPSVDEAWLADSAGRRYASELRLVLVDPRAFQPLGEVVTDHHLALHGDWSVWRWFALRGAGFSSDLVAALGNAAVAAVDAWIVDAKRVDAILDAELATSVGRRHGRLSRTREALARFDSTRAVTEIREDALAGEVTEIDHALERVKAAFGVERDRIRGALREWIQDPRVLEAITWQNRAAASLIARLVEQTENHKSRERELSLANYLQRYAMKNDTIGFFGPICYGEFVADASSTSSPGPTLLARRYVYFEHWGIDVLASQLSQDLDLLLEIAPRRVASVRLEGSMLHHGLNERIELPAEFAAVVAMCDGVATAREIAEALLRDAAVTDVDDVYEMLEQLRAQNVVCWQLDVPTATAHPERLLAELLSRAAEPARGDALAKLQELTSARDRVAAAAGDAGSLARALDDLDQVFTRITGSEPRRHAGKTYAGRTLVYEDCWRDHELRLGSEWRRGIDVALTLVLASARWYTHAIAEGFRGRLEATYRELRAKLGEDVIDYPRFYARFVDEIPTTGSDGAGDDLVAGVQRELHARWAAVLAIPPGEHRIERRAETLAGPVAAAFAVPGPGWPTARMHSPDLMVAARTLDDALAGRGTFVLGELHTGGSTLVIEALVKDLPHAGEILAAERRDTPVRRVGIVGPKALVDRSACGPTVELDFEVELGTTRSHLPRERVLAAADLVLRDTDEGLRVCTRDGRVTIDPIAFFERILRTTTVGKWSLLSPEAHTPRVTLDRLVVVRERWRFPTAELAFADAKTPFARFAGARRWARQHEIPRYVFAKFPNETKPLYVDLGSSLYVDLFAKLALQSPVVTLTEMLPAPDELWLADREQRRYTAEIRLCAVDAIEWRPTA